MIAMTRNLAAGVALLLLAACGAGNNSLPDAAAERAQYPEKPTLSIADGSLLGDRSAVRFSMVEDDGGITATIDLAKAAQLNTLYTDIAYDPRQYSLDSIETAAGLDGRQLLSLGVNVQPGLVQTGHVLPNFDLAEPLDSSGTLATLHFSRGPQACPGATLAIAPVRSCARSCSRASRSSSRTSFGRRCRDCSNVSMARSIKSLRS